jgi:hypothetical protein
LTKSSNARKVRRGIVPEVPAVPQREVPKFNCAGCRFVDKTEPTRPFCRRLPPQLVVVPRINDTDNGVRKFFPVVDPIYDWCGEHSDLKPSGFLT